MIQYNLIIGILVVLGLFGATMTLGFAIAPSYSWTYPIVICLVILIGAYAKSRHPIPILNTEIDEAILKLRGAQIATNTGTKDLGAVFQELQGFLIAENDSPSEVIWRHLVSNIGVSHTEAPAVLTRLQDIGVLATATRRSLETFRDFSIPMSTSVGSPMPYRTEPIDKPVIVITLLGTAVRRELAKEQ